jgi:Tfp pilus assembly protein PilW
MRRYRNDAGTTLAEMMMVVALFLTASAVMFSSLATFQTNDVASQQVTQMRQDMRLALDQIARDLRGTTSIGLLGASATYASQLDLVTLASDGVTVLPVRWRVSGSTLVREPLVSHGGVAASTRGVLGSLSTTSGVFRYFDSTGAELVAGVATAASLAGCTTRVRITVSEAPSATRAATSDSVDVAIRNLVPGTLGC